MQLQYSLQKPKQNKQHIIPVIQSKRNFYPWPQTIPAQNDRNAFRHLTSQKIIELENMNIYTHFYITTYQIVEAIYRVQRLEIPFKQTKFLTFQQYTDFCVLYILKTSIVRNLKQTPIVLHIFHVQYSMYSIVSCIVQFRDQLKGCYRYASDKNSVVSS